MSELNKTTPKKEEMILMVKRRTFKKWVMVTPRQRDAIDRLMAMRDLIFLRPVEWEMVSTKEAAGLLVRLIKGDDTQTAKYLDFLDSRYGTSKKVEVAI